MNIHNPFTLPELEFVGGSTQELVFHCYHEQNGKPTDLSSCTANFSLISYVNKYGSPLVSKAMDIRAGTDNDDGISISWLSYWNLRIRWNCEENTSIKLR